MKDNIMMIIPTLSSGGAERTLSNLANSLKDYYNIKFVVFDAQKNIYKCDVPIIDLNITSKIGRVGKAYNLIKKIIKVKKIKKNEKIKCTISFLQTPNLINVLTKGKDKVIISIRNEASKYNKKTDYYTIKHADLVVAISRMVEYGIIDKFQIEKKKSKTIYNGCDINRIQKQAKMDENIKFKEVFNANNKVIINIGRLTNQKGQWHLIRAFKLVVEKVKNAKLVILGEGELEGYLRELISDLDLENKVLLIGFTSNPYKYMIKSDVFVFSSLYEGLGNSILEAMACQLPIISTDCKSGPREILAPNTDLKSTCDDVEKCEYGILVPVCDGTYYRANDKITEEEKKLADAIIKMINDEDELKKYKEKSAKRILDFEQEKNTQEWINTIERLITR